MSDDRRRRGPDRAEARQCDLCGRKGTRGWAPGFPALCAAERSCNARRRAFLAPFRVRAAA